MKLRFLLATLSLCATAVQAQTEVTLPAEQDTTIFGSSTGNSDGGGAGLFAGDGGGSKHRALLEFNVSSIPSYATITDVKLVLTLGMTAGGGMGGGISSATIGVYSVSTGWGEGTTGNKTQDASGIPGSGSGFTAAAGDATWASAVNGTTSWTAAGGDHAASASASLGLTGNTAGTAYTWDSQISGNSGLAGDVQNWVDGATTNNGWELINADESSMNTFYAFYSKEWPTFTSGTGYNAVTAPTEVPELVVDYTVPEPGAGWLMASTLLGLLSLRRPRRRA